MMDLFVVNSRRSDGKPPEITRLPRSSLVDRLKCFLPEMAAANAELDEHSRESCNIENISDSDERVIEMNIAVFERDKSSSSSDESSDESNDETTDSHGSDVDSHDDDEHRDSVVECTSHDSRLLTRIKMPKTSRKQKPSCSPRVEVLNSSDNSEQEEKTADQNR